MTASGAHSGAENGAEETPDWPPTGGHRHAGHRQRHRHAGHRHRHRQVGTDTGTDSPPKPMNLRVEDHCNCRVEAWTFAPASALASA